MSHLENSMCIVTSLDLIPENNLIKDDTKIEHISI